ncbi:MAG: hypothetical protein J6Q51_03600 [Clostridia bacterium]|nr:hypothetical protein [Clostridia bacterium]
MARKLLNPEPDHDIADIVLSLTDTGNLESGIKLYSVFKHEQFLQVMNLYTLDVKIIKQILGINGAYVERKGDVYSDKFNPKRNRSVLTIKPKEMDKRAKDLFAQLVKEMQDLAKLSARYSKK